MEFIFEKRKNSGATAGLDSPESPAVRITIHKPTKKESRSRLYFSFTLEAVKEARWIKGDRILVGVDPDSGCICFKRDQENGYSLQVNDRGNSNVQVSVSENSVLWNSIQSRIGKWLQLSSSGLLLVTTPSR